MIEAGDGTASQFQALLAYANMLRLKGDTALADEYFQKVEYSKTYFNTDWGIKEGVSEYIRGYDKDGNPLEGFGREASLLMATKLITEPGAKTDVFLSYLDEKYTNETPPNI